MNAGRLRRRVTLQSPSVTRDSFGDEVITWVDVLTTWASIRPLTGREVEIGKALRGDVTHDVKLRYNANAYPGPTWRVVYGSRLLEVKHVINVDERNREVALVCNEIVEGA